MTTGPSGGFPRPVTPPSDGSDRSRRTPGGVAPVPYAEAGPSAGSGTGAVRRGAAAEPTASWEELVSTALVGADRRAVPPESLLERAAEQVVRMRAGRRLSRGAPPAPAAAETLPLVSAAAADRLARMLAGEQSRLLTEWLETAAARRVRVPAEMIPELLDLGAGDRSIRAHLGAVTGARGRWLAGLNSAWAYLLEEPAHVPPGEVWELGTSGDRRAFLAGLRCRDPAAARELLERGWNAETPEDRAAFVTILADGLGMADEPFLEAALDDRRREVRQAAADLLTRLPRSRLARRMTARASRLVTRNGTGIRAEPPEGCDAAMERDGVRARPPAGMRTRGWWLQQVVAHTPLSFWPGHLGMPPDEIARARIGDWEREVRMGWTRAAILQRDTTWARALFVTEQLTDLLAVLPPEERSRRAAELVRSRPVDGQMVMMLGGVPRPWGRHLAKAVLKKIVETTRAQPWNAGELIRLAGERLDPATHEQAGEVPELAATLRFRFEMLKELA
ncbi:hypothetical protein GCM10010116_37420 [Microbispora rosea subsp. aerata]|nr:DUF5691 domain-containing protein [Microbispora rosea]GGO18572.1 hypothetical protein GCM10010116_37420 [Microbispora rosea subsp. aerata]GIH54361.1 hypothetical protein Mro02_12750 [Microbispora rosea subsp. aerata]GLJ81331.1 hypothetical protein GCM10017588_00540 [Microbispora rosea subsp. aerata]